MTNCTKCTTTEATHHVEMTKFNGKTTVEDLCTVCLRKDMWNWLDYRDYIVTRIQNNSSTTKSYIPNVTYLTSNNTVQQLQDNI